MQVGNKGIRNSKFCQEFENDIATGSLSRGDEFRHVGDYLLKSHFKLTGDKVVPIPMKPIAFRVFTDGVIVKVSTEGEEDAHTKFEIYRSDGIAR